MNTSHLLRVFGISLFTGAGIFWYWASTRSETSPAGAPPEGPVYHADAEHLWNRLYEGLCLRVGGDGMAYGRDRFEPLLWLGSKHLLEGDSHERAVKLLNEFLKQHGEKLFEDPLRRALFQRDLWMVFRWLEGQHARSGESGVQPARLEEARRRLRPPLAAAIRRLALNPAEIQKLPDNYGDAIKSGRFARTPAEATPDRPYLPPDLFSGETWVCVGRDDGPVAARHVAPENTLANSAFLIFLKLPGGRDEAIKFLKRESAPLPSGAEVALVRRALLIASSAEVTPTKLIESVQLRTYGEAEVSVSEFRLSRRLLIAGEAGGLRAVQAEERDFKTGFASLPWDPFEDNPYEQPLDVHKVTITNQCLACHNPERSPGLESHKNGSLSEITLSEAMQTAVKWKTGRDDWKTLQKLLDESAAGNQQ